MLPSKIRPRQEARTQRALAGLGVEATEERIYRILLQRKDTRATQLAKQLRIPQTAVKDLLLSLEHKGLASRSADADPRYFAVPPDIAIEALIAQRQRELFGARAAVVELRDIAQSTERSRDEDSREVEILTHEAIAKVFPQIMTAARSEIICFERMPMLVWDATPNDAEVQCLARGVDIRIIADNAMLNVPRHVERLRAAVQAGESYRVFSGLPMKMVVVDRSVGIMPIHLAQPTGPHLLLRSSSLLEALCEIFEIFWRLAAPFELSTEDLRINASRNDTDPLISLLSAGLNDKAIEHELGISRRTLTRRIVDLMKRHGASTRFQFGWLTARDSALKSRNTS